MKLSALIAALLIPCALMAQSRVTIPVQDPVYRDIDRLIALRLVEVGLYGQRPYSRREIARLTREARAAIDKREVSASTRPRGIATDGLGSVDAMIDPLLGGRAGRSYSQEENLAVEARGELHLGEGLSLRLQQRVVNSESRLEAASAIVPVRNVTIEAG